MCAVEDNISRNESLRKKKIQALFHTKLPKILARIERLSAF